MGLIMGAKTDLKLWQSEKYVSWPYSLPNPVVRVPRPSGIPELKAIQPRPDETEESTFSRCVAYRDKRGVEVWGESRWAELLKVQARSVARHRERPAGPQTGVTHYQRRNSAPVWIASWYELQADGTRRKRSIEYSYGTSRAKYQSSDQAEAAAIDRRNLEETRWYCTGGIGDQRHANPL